MANVNIFEVDRYLEKRYLHFFLCLDKVTFIVYTDQTENIVYRG